MGISRALAAAALWLLACQARADPPDVAALAAQIDVLEKQVALLEQKAGPFLRAPKPIAPESDSLVPLYLGGGGEIPRVDEHKRLAARHALLVELERGKVSEVDYDDGVETKIFAPPWEKAGFVIAPVEVMLAIGTAATAPFRGVELDLRVDTQERGVHFVTLTHELDGSLRVIDVPSSGLPPESLPRALDDEDFRKRFGVGRLDGGEGRWSPTERQSLARALELLSERERARIRGLELRRESRPRRMVPVKGACGTTTLNGGERWVELYDCAFRDDDIAFTGSPRAPDRASVRVILHELGHAIAAAPVLAFRLELEQLSSAGESSSRLHHQLQSDPATLSDAPELAALGARLAKVAGRMQALAKATATSTGPAVTAFSQVPGAENGITRYGREAPTEAFAEAFSLFHADPDALRRVAPAVLEFFQNGKHLLGSH